MAFLPTLFCGCSTLTSHNPGNYDTVGGGLHENTGKHNGYPHFCRGPRVVEGRWRRGDEMREFSRGGSQTGTLETSTLSFSAKREWRCSRDFSRILKLPVCKVPFCEPLILGDSMTVAENFKNSKDEDPGITARFPTSWHEIAPTSQKAHQNLVTC